MSVPYGSLSWSKLLSPICEGAAQCWWLSRWTKKSVGSHAPLEFRMEVRLFFMDVSGCPPLARGYARLHWLFSVDGAGRLFQIPPLQSLAKRLHIED